MKIFRRVLAAWLCCAGLVFAAEAAQVQLFSPQGTAKEVRQVTVRFSEPMVPLGDPRLDDPFSIHCPEKGRGRWVDGKNWVYDFERDLPAGLVCEFEIKPDLKTLAGGALSRSTKVFLRYRRPNGPSLPTRRRKSTDRRTSGLYLHSRCRTRPGFGLKTGVLLGGRHSGTGGPEAGPRSGKG